MMHLQTQILLDTKVKLNYPLQKRKRRKKKLNSSQSLHTSEKLVELQYQCPVHSATQTHLTY